MIQSLLFALGLIAAMASCSQQPIGVGAKAPADAQVLFDGSRQMLDDQWTYWEGPRFSSELPIKWEVVDDPAGTGTVVNSNDPTAAGGQYGTADIVTKQKFRDFRLHVEFFIRREKGNSGVYLQNRYEIQVLDGDSTRHGMGTVINETESPYFAYKGVGQWNAYDIQFRAARFENGELTMKCLLVLGTVGLTLLLTGSKGSANPFYAEWDTPFGVPDFDKVKLEHYQPAFDEGIKLHKQEIAAIIEND